jgi:pimeloyl-ACP methyl ester carboxylesterase
MAQVQVSDLFIKLQLTTVYGKLAGNPSDPLVLGLHGWSQRNGWRTWEPLMEPLAGAGYCVASVDMPGWGDSPPVDALPLLGERAVAVVVDILDGLQKETAAVMGKSWGGAVAVDLALAYPQRVSKLILTAPALREMSRLPEVSQPVLLVWAEDDPVIPVGNAQRIAKALANATLVVYPSGGHSAAPKNAATFAPIAVSFLQG